MSEMHKYPRTAHLRGSRFQNGDHDLEAVPFEELRGKHLVIEEKMDGANAGISFSESGELLLQSRGHYLRGGPRERHFAPLKQWAWARQTELFYALQSRYVMFGEWMYAKHTVYYDALPHYFMEFDILDTETNTFLSTPERQKLLAGVPVVPVKVLTSGPFDRIEQLETLVTRSNFITDERLQHFLSTCVSVGILGGAFGNREIQEALATGDWNPNMEGLYVKWEEDGIVKGRYKFVRDTFTNAILDQDEHWLNRPIVPNKLVDGAYEAMFT